MTKSPHAAPEPSDPDSTADGLFVPGLNADRTTIRRLYDSLRALAKERVRQGLTAGDSLQATALVHEVWIKLANAPDVPIRDVDHYRALAAQAMRWVVVDHARRRSAQRRRAVRDQVSVSELSDPVDQGSLESATNALALDQALSVLESEHPRKAQVVMFRHFAGLSVAETAAAMKLSPATVKREWQFARAWLVRQMTGVGDAPGNKKS